MYPARGTELQRAWSQRNVLSPKKFRPSTPRIPPESPSQNGGPRKFSGRPTSVTVRGSSGSQIPATRDAQAHPPGQAVSANRHDSKASASHHQRQTTASLTLSPVVSSSPVVGHVTSYPESLLTGTSMSPSVRSAKKQALSKLKDLVWDTTVHRSDNEQPLRDSRASLASKQVIDLTDKGLGSVTARANNPVSPLANRKVRQQNGLTLKRSFSTYSERSFATEGEENSDDGSPNMGYPPGLPDPQALTQAPSGRLYRLWNGQYPASSVLAIFITKFL